MGCQIIISTAAFKELQQSFDWYENVETDLGFRFIDFVDKVLGIIELYPESFPCKKDRFREAALKRFPFLIIYEYSQEENKVFVLHVFHSRRHPRRKLQTKL